MENWKIKLKESRLAKSLNKTEFARRVGVSPPTATDWEKSFESGGIKDLKGENLLKVCAVLDIDPAWLIGHQSEFVSRITATHPDDAPMDDAVYIPESRIEFSAGNGRSAHYNLVEDEEPATYRLSWFQKYGINPDHVRRFRVSGDSMEPMLYAKDTILVNLDETRIVDNKLYAIRYGDELRVKYLRRLIDGTLVLRSVNPAYDDEKISPELVNEHISVIGRVRDASGTGGL